jgi:hypothetical protein
MMHTVFDDFMRGRTPFNTGLAAELKFSWSDRSDLVEGLWE